MRNIHVHHDFSVFTCVYYQAINPLGVFQFGASIEELFVSFVLDSCLLKLHFWRKSMHVLVRFNAEPLTFELSQKLLTIIFISLGVGFANFKTFFAIKTWSLYKRISSWLWWCYQNQISRKELILKNLDYVSYFYLWPFFFDKTFVWKAQWLHFMVELLICAIPFVVFITWGD